MIHNVYIINTDGTCYVSRKYGSLEIDESLISGFITAINTFASQIIQRPVDELRMGDLKFIYSRSSKLDVIYAVCADSDAATDELKNIFDQVDHQFVAQYEEMFRDDLLKDITIFNEFIPSLDALVDLFNLLATQRGEREGRFHISKNVGNLFKKMIRVISFTKSTPEETPVGVTQDTTIEITPLEGELSQVYAINEDVVKNVKAIPTEDAIQRMSLHYCNGSNSVEDVILSLQLLGYKPSPEILLEFFKGCESSGYLKIISG